MARVVKCKGYQLRTSAPPDVVAKLLGEAWLARKQRHRAPVTEIANGYRFQDRGGLCEFDVLLAEEPGGTLVTTDVLRTKTTQDKFLMLVPMGPKEVHVNWFLKDVIAKKLNDLLIEKGYNVEVEQAVQLLGG